MRKAILAVPVIAALQGFASGASASDPATDMQGATEMASVSENQPRTTLQQGRVQRAGADAQAEKSTLETRTADSNSGRSKPVRVYFFFGGR